MTTKLNKKEITKTIQAPSIIRANTYFWTPAANASGRRYNEDRRESEMKSFVDSLPTMENIEIHFEYRESCKNVYKTFRIFRNGKKTNIVGLRAECRKHGVELEWEW